MQQILRPSPLASPKTGEGAEGLETFFKYLIKKEEAGYATSRSCTLHLKIKRRNRRLV